jgi:hypothetical protein
VALYIFRSTFPDGVDIGETVSLGDVNPAGTTMLNFPSSDLKGEPVPAVSVGVVVDGVVDGVDVLVDAVVVSAFGFSAASFLHAPTARASVSITYR